MRSNSHDMGVVFAGMFFLAVLPLYGSIAPQITLRCNERPIHEGDPLVVSLTFEYEDPQLYNGKPLRGVPHYARLECSGPDPNKEPVTVALYPRYLRRADNEGLVFEEVFTVFDYDCLDSNLVAHRLVFGEPGVYRLLVKAGVDSGSNETAVTVLSPSAAQHMAMSALLPDDYVFLSVDTLCVDDEFRRMQVAAVARLEEVVNNIPQTMIGRWSAASVGLVYYEEYAKATRSRSKGTKDGHRPEESNLLESAEKYLSIAYKLPDEFPVREAVVDGLVKVNQHKGDLDKAKTFMEELAAKYPYGRFGERYQNTGKAMQTEESPSTIRVLATLPDCPTDPNGRWLLLYDDEKSLLTRKLVASGGNHRIVIDGVAKLGGDLLVCWDRGPVCLPWTYIKSVKANTVTLPQDADLEVKDANLVPIRFTLPDANSLTGLKYLQFYYQDSNLPWWQVELPTVSGKAAGSSPPPIDLRMLPGPYRVKAASEDGVRVVSLGSVTLTPQSNKTYELRFPGLLDSAAEPRPAAEPNQPKAKDRNPG